MRRRETPLDPAVAAELDALEAALAGDPAADPELTALVRDVRMEAPAMTPAFRAQLDERVRSEFARGASDARAGRSGRLRALLPGASARGPRGGSSGNEGRGPSRPPLLRRRSLLPALGVAGCLLAALIAVVLATGRSGSDDDAGGGVAATQVAPAESDSGAGGAGESAGSAPSPDLAAPSTKSGDDRAQASPAPSPTAPSTTGGRHVERNTRLELTTTDVQRVADGVVRATQAAGGFVQLSQVRTGDGNGGATFVLRVPTAKLDEALASLSKLGHVRAMEQSANDITGAYDGAQSRLQDARAERRGLLRALGKASTAQEIASLKARIADNRRELNRLQSEFNAVRRRATYATVQVDVIGRERKQPAAPGGSWSPGDALHDALRVLEVAAGVALIGLAVLIPLGLVGGAGAVAAGALKRRRREAALGEPI